MSSTTEANHQLPVICSGSCVQFAPSADIHADGGMPQPGMSMAIHPEASGWNSHAVVSTGCDFFGSLGIHPGLRLQPGNEV